MMSWKKILCGALMSAMIFSASGICSAAPESANAKLTRIEIDTYGSERSGALLDRIGILERNYSGRNMSGNMNARIEAIYDILYDNSAGPGILAKINSLEWNVNHEVASGGIDARLSALENQILGKTSEGTFNERIRNLATASYGEAILPIAQVQIPANTLIKVVTTAPVSSKTLQMGDTIPIKVAEDVFVDEILVFASGLTGEGTVSNVRRAKNIFSNGKIETNFNALKTIDGQIAQIFTGTEAFDAMNAQSLAQGLSLVGQTFSGKNKDLDSVLVHGKNIDLAAGVELYVQTKEPLVVYGVRTDGGGIPIEEEPITTDTPDFPQSIVKIFPTEPEEPDEPEDPAVVTIEPTELNDPPASTESEPPAQVEPTEPEPTAQVEPDPADDDGEIIEIIDED